MIIIIDEEGDALAAEPNDSNDTPSPVVAAMQLWTVYRDMSSV